jgi:hypothetical protein
VLLRGRGAPCSCLRIGGRHRLKMKRGQTGALYLLLTSPTGRRTNKINLQKNFGLIGQTLYECTLIDRQVAAKERKFVAEIAPLASEFSALSPYQANSPSTEAGIFRCSTSGRSYWLGRRLPRFALGRITGARRVWLQQSLRTQ